MPVGSFVVTVSRDPAARADLLEALPKWICVELGEPQDCRLPMVVWGDTVEDFDATCSAVAALTGLESLDLVFVDFSDVDHVVTQPLRRARREHGGEDGPA
jgi:hypothetical protein